MTSHHDVAGVTSALRSELNLGRAWRLEVASLLESQARALSEAEANFAKLSEMALESELLRDRTLTSGEAWKARALAAETRLAEAMKVIGFYADRRRYEGPNLRPIPDDPFAKPDSVYIHDVTRDGGANARAFTNAAKEKTDAQSE